MVERLFTEAKKAKEQVDRKRLENYKFFRGNQWPQKRPSYRHSEVLNYIAAEVYSVLVLLTDSRPQIEVLPEDPSDLEFAEIMSSVIKGKWDRDQWARILAEAITDAAIGGTAIGAVPWKPEMAEGLGDFDFETVEPNYFFPDPAAQSEINDEHCDYVIEAKPVKVSKVRAKYPDKKEFLKADLHDLSSSYQDTDVTDEVTYKSPSDNRVPIESDTVIRPIRPNQILLMCCYLKSDELVEEEKDGPVDEATGIAAKVYQTKLKYPNGRKIVTANGVLLEDGPNPYRGGKFPYARLVDHALPREFWGLGEVEQLKSPQQIVNKLISYVLDVLILTGNPIWVVDNTSGVDTDNITNQPGLIIEKNPGSEVDRKEGVQLQPFVLDTLTYMAEKVLGKLGSTADVSKGVAPSEDSSGYAIAQLKEAAQTKIRGKGREIEYFLKYVGGLSVDRILDGYTTPRIIRLTNNENAADYFKISITDVQDEMGETSKIATVVKYKQMPDGYVAQDAKQYPVKSALDVKISVGSTLPFAKAENRAISERFYDKGIIDAEELLTQVEYPNKEKIIERMKARMAAMPPTQGAPNAGPNAGPSAPVA